MIRHIIIKKTYLFASILILLVSACSKKTEPTKVSYPYEFVASKTEEGAEMFLYTYNDTPNVDTLIAFCKEKKKDFEHDAFHFIVFFDKKNNAVFPTNPLTALYINEEELKHIKAIYTYNHINKYNELVVYHPNGWDGKPQIIKVP